MSARPGEPQRLLNASDDVVLFHLSSVHKLVAGGNDLAVLRIRRLPRGVPVDLKKSSQTPSFRMIRMVALDIDGTLLTPGVHHTALPDADMTGGGARPARRGYRGGARHRADVSRDASHCRAPGDQPAADLSAGCLGTRVRRPVASRLRHRCRDRARAVRLRHRSWVAAGVV